MSNMHQTRPAPSSEVLHIIWQRSGIRQWGLGKRRTQLKAGEWLVHDAGQPLEAMDSSDAHVLQIKLARRLFLTPARALNALLLKPLPSRGCAHIAAEMLAAALQQSLDAGQELLEAAGALIDQALADECESRGLLCTAPAPAIQREQLQAYLLERLSDHGLSMDRVAEAFGMSRRSLYKLFETWGMTPRAFIQNAKLERACTLLSEPDRPVSHIARQCGFTDPAHFSRAFQARHGAAPSAWRSLHA